MARKIGCVILVSLVVACDRGGGTVTETTGTVQSVAYRSSDTGPSGQAASVRLADGSTVHAEVVTAKRAIPGSSARLRVTTRSTGAKYYEVIEVSYPK